MQLEVGMIVYSDERFSGVSKYEVVRVTPKQAIVETRYRNGNVCETRFKREVKENWPFYAIGDSGYSKTAYYLETPELIAKYHRATLERRYAKIKAAELTDSQLENILKEAGK